MTAFLPNRTTRQAVRFSRNSSESFEDIVATEYALTIYVNDNEMATIVCTPHNLSALVTGFLASEGVIHKKDEIESMDIVTTLGVARVRVAGGRHFSQAFFNKRYIASCCGKSRQSFYFQNDAHTAKTAEDTGVRYAPAVILDSMERLQAASDVFESTGGVHSAALCHHRNGLLLVQSDIGRHNALDKLYGHLLEQDESPGSAFIAFTGRLSSEMLLKAAKIGVGLIVAKSAPTAMAIDMADSLNITAIGFARRDRFTAYTHPWRIGSDSNN